MAWTSLYMYRIASNLVVLCGMYASFHFSPISTHFSPYDYLIKYLESETNLHSNLSVTHHQIQTNHSTDSLLSLQLMETLTKSIQQ